MRRIPFSRVGSLLLALHAVVLAAARPAAAQGGTGPVNATEARENTYSYWALLLTPTAALAPQLSPIMFGGRGGMTGLSVRYGRVHPFQDATDDFVHDAFAVGLDLPVGAATSGGLTVGYMRNNPCVGCEGHLMLGGHVETRLTSTELGTSDDFRSYGAPRPTLRVGLRAEAGYAPDVFDDARAVSVALALPVALAVPTHSALRVVPFVTPAAAYGRYTAGDAFAGRTRFMLGGGVTLVDLAPGLSLNVGVQHPFYEFGRTEAGVGVSFRVR